MRVRHLLLLALAALALLAGRVEASKASMQAQAEMSALAELESWLVASDFEDSLVQTEMNSKPAAAAAAKPAAVPAAAAPAPAAAAAAAAAPSVSPRMAALRARFNAIDPKAGTVQQGGRTPPSGEPDMIKGAEDGSELPPWDQFGIAKRHEAMEARRQARRQAQVDKKNALERAAAAKALEKRRQEALKREAAEAKREAEMTARAKKEKDALLAAGDQGFETDLVELENTVDTDAETEAEAEADSESEAEAEAEAESESESEAELSDAERLEAEAMSQDAELMELEAAVESSVDVEAELEAELEAEISAEMDAALDAQLGGESEGEASQTSELDIPENLDSAALPDSYASLVETQTEAAPVLPSLHVTYGREMLSEEQFDNSDSRAVFARRARGQEIVRFEKTVQSDGGVAVVKGVTKLPCGKELTDTGLFAASVSENPGPTVEAANPQAPIFHDDNIVAMKQLPVLPQYKEEKKADEYGDMQEE